WINADDVLMPGALSAICGIVGEHPEVEWMGGPQYVFETDVQQQVLQRSTPTPTAVIREGLCDGKHWEMLQQEGTFFSRALWFRAKHGLKGFELAGDWNFWREMAHHGVYYQYESPLGAFRRRVGQLSVERIGDYRAEIERVMPLEVRRGRFEELDLEQEWNAKVIRFDDGSGRMVVGVESVREVYQKVGKSSLKSEQAGSNGWFEQPKKLQQDERFENAVAAYNRAIVQNPNFAEDHYNLGQALGQLHRWEEAIVGYQKAISLGFAGAEVRCHLGYALGQLGRWKEAIVEYQLVLEVNPQSAEVNQCLGDAYSKIGLKDKAITTYRRTLEIKPYLFEVEEKLKKLLQIVDVANKSQVELTSDRNIGIIPLLECYEVIANQPEDYQGYIDLANTFAQKQDFNQAIIFYKIALKINPNDAESTYQLGRALEVSNRIEQAVKHYKRAIDLNPKDKRYAQALELSLKSSILS
ncbi:MAG: tetratricopeptide repeat protein, partial [Trichodesmium sp. MAG_R04]|nr:tetratricopeptide repeat protein [Trichodesmium sp. MAG_R04]